MGGRDGAARAARKENEPGNARLSLEDAPVAGSRAPFEELLERELAKANTGAGGDRRDAAPKKRPFLKKGARGWWMQQPDASAKMQKHVLMSAGEEETKTQASALKKKAPVLPAQKKSNADEDEFSAPRRAMSSYAASLLQVEPPLEDDRRGQELDFHAEPADWRDASFRSNATMGISNVRRSFEAKREREADELAEFEAIEKQLAEERDEYLLEKQEEHKKSERAHVSRDSLNGGAAGWHTRQYPSSPASAFSEHHSNNRSFGELFAPSPTHNGHQELDARSDFIFDGKQATAFQHDNEWRRYSTEESVDFEHRFSDPLFGREHRAPSELSAISFNDSEPWDEGLSFQPQSAKQVIDLNHETASARPQASSDSSASLLGEGPFDQNRYGSFDSISTSDGLSRKPTLPKQYHGGFDTVHEDPELSDEMEHDTAAQAPVSSLVRQVFGTQDDEVDSQYSTNDEPLPSRNRGGRDVRDRESISTLKQKLTEKLPSTGATGNRSRQAASGRPVRGQTRKNSGPPSATGARQRPPAIRQKASSASTRPSTLASKNGPIFPAVIEEKLFELEEEVKFYKAETLQLQRRRENYEQEAQKLAKEREEFTRYQQEQRTLIEKEWQRERAKMKKEQQLMDRQWKLRMNATASTQDRKAKGEIEVLKAQLVKLQVDENARTSKWKSSNENLRQRIAELEDKNRELREEIKFLESERLAQWEKFERQLKEKQDQIDRLNSASGDSRAGESRNPFETEATIRTTSDLFSIRSAADELLSSWSKPPQDTTKASPYTDVDALEARGQLPTQVVQPIHRRTQSSNGDYNPKRYSLDKASSEPSTSIARLDESTSQATASKNAQSLAASTSSDSAVQKSGGYQPPKYMPAARTSTDAQERQTDSHNSAEQPSVSSSPFQSLDRQMAREILHAGGKKEVVFTDGSKRIIFPDGNEKEIDANGHTIIKFTNGDRKEVFPDTGISIYYYYEAQTKLTTYPDQTKVYEFPNHQVEKTFPDGSTEIKFADGITKTISPSGDEFSVFPDGTTMLERKDGLREVALLNGKKIRYYPDGRMACVSRLGGEEIEVRSDAELRRLMER